MPHSNNTYKNKLRGHSAVKKTPVSFKKKTVVRKTPAQKRTLLTKALADPNVKIIYLRPSRRKKVTPGQYPNFPAPTYTLGTSSAMGGVHSYATLGPNSYIAMGSASNPLLPSGIASARTKYPSSCFKAGHLLNAEFRGSGFQAANLTILSSSGNSAHKNFDNNVKHALSYLKKAYDQLRDLYVDILLLDFGIEVDIQVSTAKWGTTVPDSHICKFLVCTAQLVNVPHWSNLADTDGNTIDVSGDVQLNTYLNLLTIYVNTANLNGQQINNNT